MGKVEAEAEAEAEVTGWMEVWPANGEGLKLRLVGCTMAVLCVGEALLALVPAISVEEMLDIVADGVPCTTEEGVVVVRDDVAVFVAVGEEGGDEAGAGSEDVDSPVIADHSSGETAEKVSSVTVPLQPPFPQHIHRSLLPSYSTYV